MAVSKLMTHGLNRAAVNNSLLALKNYAVEDKGMKVNSCPPLSQFEVIITFLTIFDKSIVQVWVATNRCSDRSPRSSGRNVDRKSSLEWRARRFMAGRLYLKILWQNSVPFFAWNLWHCSSYSCGPNSYCFRVLISRFCTLPLPLSTQHFLLKWKILRRRFTLFCRRRRKWRYVIDLSTCEPGRSLISLSAAWSD